MAEQGAIHRQIGVSLGVQFTRITIAWLRYQQYCIPISRHSRDRQRMTTAVQDCSYKVAPDWSAVRKTMHQFGMGERACQMDQTIFEICSFYLDFTDRRAGVWRRTGERVR